MDTNGKVPSADNSSEPEEPILEQDDPQQDDRAQENTETLTSTENSASQTFRSKSNYSLKLKKEFA